MGHILLQNLSSEYEGEGGSYLEIKENKTKNLKEKYACLTETERGHNFCERFLDRQNNNENECNVHYKSEQTF